MSQLYPPLFCFVLFNLLFFFFFFWCGDEVMKKNIFEVEKRVKISLV